MKLDIWKEKIRKQKEALSRQIEYRRLKRVHRLKIESKRHKHTSSNTVFPADSSVVAFSFADSIHLENIVAICQKNDIIQKTKLFWEGGVDQKRVIEPLLWITVTNQDH